MSFLAFTSNKPGGGGGGGGVGPTVTLSTYFLNGSRKGFGTVTTRGTVMITITGGTPPYVGEWVEVVGLGDTNPTNPGGLNTKFSAFAELVPNDFTSTWKYTVTDAALEDGESDLLNVYLSATQSTEGPYELV